jgi:hypothetical protein
MLKIATIAVAIAISSSAAAQWTLSTLRTRTLTNVEFSIPMHLPAQPSLLVIGFTSASRDQTSAWSRLLAQDDDLRGLVVTYQVAVIDDVPAMMRRFVIRGIRSGVPEALHDKFLVVSEQSEDWKSLASYSEPDAAYLVLLDEMGEVGWVGNGAPTAASLQSIRVKAEELRSAR